MTAPAGVGIAVDAHAITVAAVDADGRLVTRRQLSSEGGVPDPEALADRLGRLTEHAGAHRCPAVVTWRDASATPVLDVDVAAPAALATAARTWSGRSGTAVLAATDEQGRRLAVAMATDGADRLTRAATIAGLVVLAVEPMSLTLARADGDPAYFAALIAAGALARAERIELGGADHAAPDEPAPPPSVWVVQRVDDPVAASAADRPPGRVRRALRRWWAWGRRRDRPAGVGQ